MTFAKVKNMTEGNPTKLILAFAVPLFIGNVFQQFYSLVDTMIVGHTLGDNGIAAIGATSALYSLVMSFAWGLNSGYAIVVTKYFGANDKNGFKKSVAAMFLLNLLCAVLLTAMVLPLLDTLLKFLKTPEGIFEDAKVYIFIICAGMVTTLAYNMFAGLLRAMGNSFVPLLFLILSSLLNGGMDALFVIIFKMGVAGAALATVLAQAISAICCAVYVFKAYRQYLPKRQDYKPNKAIYGEMLTTGLSMAMMQCVFSVGSVILSRAINAMEEIIITAHTTARRLIEIFMMPLSTIASATSTFVGQNRGAKRPDRIKSGLKSAIVMEIVWGVVSIAVIYLLARPLVVLLTDTSDALVIDNAVMNLKINLPFFPALGVLLCLRTSMQAMGQKIIPVVSSSLELAIKLVSSLWIIPLYGYVVASFTEPITWIACGVLLVAVYLIRRKSTYAKLSLAQAS